MVIEDRDLAVGTVLTATYKAQVHTCEVIQTGAGVRYRLTASGDAGHRLQRLALLAARRRGGAPHAS